MPDHGGAGGIATITMHGTEQGFNTIGQNRIRDRLILPLQNDTQMLRQAENSGNHHQGFLPHQTGADS